MGEVVSIASHPAHPANLRRLAELLAEAEAAELLALRILPEFEDGWLIEIEESLLDQIDPDALVGFAVAVPTRRTFTCAYLVLSGPERPRCRALTRREARELGLVFRRTPLGTPA